MLNEPMKEVVRRLRSGTIKQCYGHLGDRDGSRCCLGVMDDVAVEAGIIARPTSDGELLLYEGESALLSRKVAKYFGLAGCSGSFGRGDRRDELTALNDGGKTFAEIADIIESEPEGLFVTQAVSA